MFGTGLVEFVGYSCANCVYGFACDPMDGFFELILSIAVVWLVAKQLGRS